MKIEVLLSSINRKNTGIIQKCNIYTDVVFVNQCDKNEIRKIRQKGRTVTVINTTERGLSNSRNMALKYASGDVCILCDDDVSYIKGYEKIVENAFKSIPKADVIVFNINKVHMQFGDRQEKKFKEIKKIPIYKTYGSVHIAFRRESILNNNIKFNPLFGTGSKMYNMGEDSIFFWDMRRKGLNIYQYPAVIATVSFEQSSWFKGYNAHYFYDIGAYLSAVFPRFKHLMKWYYPFRLKRMSKLSTNGIILFINRGIDGYSRKANYYDYFGIGGE